MHSSGPRLLIVSMVFALRCILRWIIGAGDAEGCEPRLHGVACTAPVAYPGGEFLEPRPREFMDEKHPFRMRHSVGWLRCASTVHRMRRICASRCSRTGRASRRRYRGGGPSGDTRVAAFHRIEKMKRMGHAAIARASFVVERDEMKSPRSQHRMEGADVPLSRDV